MSSTYASALEQYAALGVDAGAVLTTLESVPVSLHCWQFDPQWFYPTDGLSCDQAKGLMVFDKLEDWTKRPEAAVQHFSSTAVYRQVSALADPSKLQNLKSIWTSVR